MGFDKGSVLTRRNAVKALMMMHGLSASSTTYFLRENHTARSDAACPNLCDSGVYCREHRQYSTDRVRGGADARGYNAERRRARRAFLQKHPLCAECRKNGKLTPATVVDHIVPHRGDQRLLWNENNWQPLCKGCHDRKTGTGL